MATRTDKNIQKLTEIFPQIQMFFHTVSIEISKTGQFTIAQYRVLNLLDLYGKMTVNDLKEHLNVAQSSASGLVDRLEQLGLIKRSHASKDKRITELKLTPKAKRIIQRRMSSMDEVYRDLLGALNSSDQKQFVGAFETLLKLIEKIETKNK